MSTLTDVLKQRKEHLEVHRSQRDANRTEWVQSLERLMKQLVDWLNEAKDQGLLFLTETGAQLSEEDLGRYETRILHLRTPDGKTVDITPVGRSVVAAGVGDLLYRARGRVDITDGIRKYMLYRVDDEWVVVDEHSYKPVPLDKTTFEQALADLFR
jgi:hypothetical protein